MNLLDQGDNTEILFFSTPCSFPIWFARHSFIIINQKGKLTRLEVFHRRNSDGSYIHINKLSATVGFPVFFGFKQWFFKPKLIARVFDKNCGKSKIIIDVVNKPSVYPFAFSYQFLGHNSNTFTRWVMQEIGVNLKLPWNCFGSKL